MVFITVMCHTAAKTANRATSDHIFRALQSYNIAKTSVEEALYSPIKVTTYFRQ